MAEMPDSHPQSNGRKSPDCRMGASSIAASRGKARPETEQLMQAVVARENLIRAYKQVVSNKGAAGVDAMTVVQLKPYLQEHWVRIKEELLTGTYKPQPVRAVEIAKPDGGVRQLGIPTVVDRLIQQALHQVLSPLFEPDFSESSYGFRPGRSRVNHDILMSRIARRVSDKRVLGLIRRYLQAGMMIDGVTSPRVEGTPQGGPLSPLLSNILLDELDKELQRRGHKFCRYADDCNIYVRTKQSGERVMESVKMFLERRLRLKVNAEKSAVARACERKYLGYSLTRHKEPRLKVAESSVKRLKVKVREIIRKGRGRSLKRLKQVIEELNKLLRGWVRYYRLAQVKGVFEDLDKWLRRKLRCQIWRQWKRAYTRAKEMMKRGLEESRAWKSATNGRGAWWNAGASHMNKAFPKSFFDRMGLDSLLSQLRRLEFSK
jgi:retron-type reverse transcriptase